jgi:hypothetical protein
MSYEGLLFTVSIWREEMDDDNMGYPKAEVENLLISPSLT